MAGMEMPTSDFWSTADEIADEIANTHECYSVSSDDDDDVELQAQGKEAMDTTLGITNPCDADLEDENISSATGVFLHEVQGIKPQNKEPLKKEEGDMMSSERRAQARKIVYAIYGTIIVAHTLTTVATYLSISYPLASSACLVLGATLGGLCYLCLVSVPVALYTFDEDFRTGKVSILLVFFILMSILLCMAVIYTVTPPFFLGGFVFIITIMSLEHAFREPSSSSEWWIPPLFRKTLMGKFMFIPLIVTLQVGIPAGWNMVSRENYVEHCVMKQWICSHAYYYYTKCPIWVIIIEFVAHFFAIVIMGSRTWKFQKESFLFRDEQLLLDRFGTKSALLIGNMYVRLSSFTLLFYGICFVVYIDVPWGVALIISSLGILLSHFVHMVIGNDQWYKGMLDMGCGSNYLPKLLGL